MINSQKQILERRNFYYEKEIGVGTWGRVYKAHVNSTMLSYNNVDFFIKKVAVKSIYVKSIPNEDPKYIEEITKKEAHIHAELSHPNIIKLYTYINDVSLTGYFYLVMEYVGCADLFNLRNKCTLNELQIINIMLQITKAIDYCHSKNIMHRDIKLENVLYSRRKNLVKIIDFGLATKFLYPLTPDRYDHCGTPEYQAYEMVCNNLYDERIDIWSMGVLFIELITGNSPFQADTYKGIKDNIKNIVIKRPIEFCLNTDPYFNYKWDIIEGMLERNLNNRITLKKTNICLHNLKTKLTNNDQKNNEPNNNKPNNLNKPKKCIHRNTI